MTALVQIRKAQRRKARLRMALMGPTGSGKTMSALRLAFGIGGKVGVIDTENGSADLYADAGDYDVITLAKPYTVAMYRAAIQAFEDAKYDVIIIDSLSHAWAGSGGLLDKQGQIAKRNPSQNSYTAWREVTPDHNALVEAMLTSPAHIIATMRVKTEYVLEVNEKGKQVPRKIGLQPVQRDGLEYEFTLLMDIDSDHKAFASKDRTRLFDGWTDTITERTGKLLLDWLNSGDAAPDPTPTISHPPPDPLDEPNVDQWLKNLNELLSQAVSEKEVMEIAGHPLVEKALASAPSGIKSMINDYLTDAYARFKEAETEDSAAEPSDVDYFLAKLKKMSRSDVDFLDTRVNHKEWLKSLAPAEYKRVADAIADKVAARMAG